MACGTCSSGSCGTGSSGCKSNGGCSTGGCNKFNTYDWLTGMEDLLGGTRNKWVEIRFKGGRKEYFLNQSTELFTGDAVIVSSVQGQDFGFVSLQGELVRLQMKKKSVKPDDSNPFILRKATPEDVSKYESIKSRELPTLYRTRELIKELKLQMKLSDVEYQWDNKKAVFYYSAEDRVDFRELIKTLASEFKVRIEMKQISLRQEAGRLGGIGVCGRELCCSTWLQDFKNVNTSAARYQNLSLNPQKLSGQCGRLKCCLNYELDTYIEALKDIPEVNNPILTTQGIAKLQKTDIFKKIMWFAFDFDQSNWIPLSTHKVTSLLELNKQGIKPNSLDPEDVGAPDVTRNPAKLNKDLHKLDDKYRYKDKKNFKSHFKRKNK